MVAGELMMTSGIHPPKLILLSKMNLCLDLSKHQYTCTDPFKPPTLTLVSILFSSTSLRICICPETWPSQLDSLYLAF